MISAGILTEVVTLQRKAYTRNKAGEQVQGFESFCTLRANIKFAKGSRALLQGEVWRPTTIVVTSRNVANGEDTCRLTWKNRAYLVDSANADRVNGTLTITATLEDN